VTEAPIAAAWGVKQTDRA